MQITCALAKAIAVHKTYQKIQLVGQLLALIFSIWDNVEVQTLNLYYVGFYIYFIYMFYIQFEMMMILRNYDDVLNIGFSTKELVTTNFNVQSVDAIIRYYQYREESKCRVLYASTKMKFHIYFVNSVYFLNFVYFIIYLIYFRSQINQETLILIFLTQMVDMCELAIALVIELPRKIRAYCRRYIRDRKRKQLIADGVEECSICTGELTDNQIMLNCHPAHQFHKECIQAWIAVQKVCPLCRAPIDQLIQ